MKRFFFATTTALALVAGSAALAQSSIVNGDTTGAPTWNRPIGAGPGLSGTGTATPFQTVNVTITQPLSFSAETTVASFDTYLHLYQTSFDPNAQLTNLVAGDDDGGAGLLSLINAASDGPFTPGQYIVVVSGFSNGSFGTYTLEINGAILGFTGALLDELQATAGTFARLSTRQSFGNTRSGAQNSFAARNQQSPLGFGDGPDAAPVLSSKNGKLMGNVYAWGEYSGLRADHNDGRSFTGQGIQFGADAAINDNFVAGLSAGYNDLEEHSALTETAGDFFYVQPYLGYRRGAWSAEASLMYGQADYDQTSAGGTGTADSDVWAIGLSVARDFAMSNSITLSPTASARYGEEDITGKSGTLAGAGSTTVDFSEYSVGARWTRQTRSGMNYVGLHADYVDTSAPTALAGGGFDPEGLSGRIELGGGVRLTANSNLSLGVHVGGIGSDLPEYAGQIRFGMNF
jgi:hypothetical protein